MKYLDPEESSPPQKQRDTHWYVFLHDNPVANEIVDRYIGGHGHTDRLRENVRCADDRRRNLWRTSFQEATAICNAGKSFRFKVTIFAQEGNTDPRKWVDPNIARHRAMLRRKTRDLED